MVDTRQDHGCQLEAGYSDDDRHVQGNLFLMYMLPARGLPMVMSGSRADVQRTALYLT